MPGSTPPPNPTQSSILGLLLEGPMTGWDLLRKVEEGLSRFWNVTPSHVYRELRVLEERGLIRAGKRGTRDRRPFTITRAGRAAFRDWLPESPGPEQIRFPLLVKLWFGRHLDPDTLTGFLETGRHRHRERLRMYEGLAKSFAGDPHSSAVIAFGIAYERAVIDWLEDLLADRLNKRERRSHA